MANLKSWMSWFVSSFTPWNSSEASTVFDTLKSKSIRRAERGMNSGSFSIFASWRHFVIHLCRWSKWEIPAFRMIGDRCLWSVSAKVRTDWRAQAFGVRLAPRVCVLGTSFSLLNLTRLFVVFIAADAGAVVIVFSLDRSIRSVSVDRLSMAIKKGEKVCWSFNFLVSVIQLALSW